MNLRDTYHRLGADARDYADADLALRVLRRRRTVRAVTGAAAAALLVAGGFGLLQNLTRSAETITAVPAVSTSAGYPSLPSSGPVGRGAVVYAPCRSSCPTLLTLEDGRTYGLGARTVHPQGNITLSPDGRWLGLPTPDGYELRDLLGGTAHRVPVPGDGRADSAYSPWAWSADSRRLILGYHASGDVHAYTDVRLDDGRAEPLTPPEGYEPVGVLPSGELVLLALGQDGDGARERVRLRVGGTARTLSATGSGVLSDADHGLSVQVSGERIFVLEYTGDSVAVLRFDPRGTLVERTPLPDGQYALGPTRDGYAVVQPPADQRGRLRLLTTDGHVLRDLPGEAEPAIPGLARH
ncbi:MULTISPECIES: hypothetical protein [Nonomuraea]|uniref:Uncharacterized protein n=1 Tax=Nonomuraea ferruginea TaxID=46174 RepID=A0ABT4T1E2_9ACTN|nr:hypothetical protein [Nonomuraea ferruginea]MDA0643341.1 hypothetical protein [Nonomuraea ferruginea]